MCKNTSKPALDWGKPLQTAAGRDAVLLTKEFESGSDIRYVVMITDEDSSGLYLYFPDGRPASKWYPTLRNKTRKVTKWYNLYTDRPGGGYWETKEEAEFLASKNEIRNYIKTLSIEIEEPL